MTALTVIEKGESLIKEPIFDSVLVEELVRNKYSLLVDPFGSTVCS